MRLFKFEQYIDGQGLCLYIMLFTRLAESLEVNKIVLPQIQLTPVDTRGTSLLVVMLSVDIHVTERLLPKCHTDHLDLFCNCHHKIRKQFLYFWNHLNFLSL